MRLDLIRALAILSVVLLPATANAQVAPDSMSRVAFTPAAWAGQAVDVAQVPGAARALPEIESMSGASDSGPTVRGSVVGVRAHQTAVQGEPLAALQQQRRVGSSKALMIVGGAAFVAGLIIGGDGGSILAVGGAVVGLYGLYTYVK